MIRYIPDWLYPFCPPDWWPNRPREPYFLGLNTLAIVAGSTVTIEVPFPKKVNALVFGGQVLVTSTNDVSVNCPLSGPWSQILVKLRNPAGNQLYSMSFNQNAPDVGFVPAENMFGVWQDPAQRPVYWPMPIPVPKGGSLQMDVQSVSAVNLNTRFTFYCALIYDYADREAA
jgi:hypothetical protein